MAGDLIVWLRWILDPTGFIHQQNNITQYRADLLDAAAPDDGIALLQVDTVAIRPFIRNTIDVDPGDLTGRIDAQILLSHHRTPPDLDAEPADMGIHHPNHT